MRLRYYCPSDRFTHCVTAHAIVDEVDRPATECVPAMLANLHIRLSGGTRYIFDDGVMIKAPRASLIGPTLSAYRMGLEPDLFVITTGFLPEGWARILSLPSHELTDRIIDAELVWGHAKIERLCEQLQAVRCDGAQVARVVEQFLWQEACLGDTYRTSSAAAIDYWLEHSPDLSLKALQDLLDTGERHMRRLVLASHGTSPKLLAMKYRALRAATGFAVRGPDPQPPTVRPDEALHHFADQSHFIRDFRRFTGWTPGTFMAEGGSVAASTIAGRYRAGIVRPLSLWS